MKDQYIEALKNFIETTREDKRKLAKDWYKKMDMQFRSLRDSGKLAELVDLLDHPDKQVRVWVATHLLVYDEGLAKNVLRNMANDSFNSMEGFNAEMILKEWDKGNLTYLVE